MTTNEEHARPLCDFQAQECKCGVPANQAHAVHRCDVCGAHWEGMYGHLSFHVVEWQSRPSPYHSGDHWGWVRI